MKQLSRQINLTSTRTTTTASGSPSRKKNHSTSTGLDFRPGVDPIRFSSNISPTAITKSAKKNQTGFSFGVDAIKFQSTSNHEPLFNVSCSPNATRGGSSPAYEDVSSNSSWKNDRFEAPSPSPSIQSDTSTARFSFNRSYANIPSPRGSFGGLGNWEMGRVDVGVQAGSSALGIRKEASVTENKVKGRVVLSQAELNELVEGIEFDEDFEMEGQESDYHSAAESVPLFPPTPSTRQARIITRAPFLPSPPDLFSPRAYPTSSTPFPHSLSPSHNTIPSPLSSRVTTRRLSTARSASKSQVIEISDGSDIDNSIEIIPTTSKAKAKGKGKAIEIDDEDEEVQILPSRAQSKPLSSTVPLVAPKFRAGWFSKSPALEVQEYSLSSAPVPPIASSSNLPPILPPSKYRTKPDIPLPVLPLTSTGKRTSKSQIEREKQSMMRNKYPIDYDFTLGGKGKGPVLVYSVDEKEVERILKEMKGPLGFDLEWKPTRIKGAKENKTALVQVCDQKTILLIHVAKMKAFPKCLKELIEDPTRIKLGVQIGGDAQKLKRDFAFVPAGLLELNNVGRTLDSSPWTGQGGKGLIGLQMLCGMYLNRFLPKESKVRCGDWEKKLSTEQKYYAANDVYSSLQIYLYLESMAPSGTNLLLLASSNSSTASSFKKPFQPPSEQTPLPHLPQPRLATSSSSTPHTKEGQQALLASLTPRQLEAYSLLMDQSLSLDEVTEKMSQSRKIQSLSVVWHYLAALTTTLYPATKEGISGVGGEMLRFDKEKLEEILNELGGSKKQVMIKEYQKWLVDNRINFDDWDA